MLQNIDYIQMKIEIMELWIQNASKYVYNEKICDSLKDYNRGRKDALEICLEIFKIIKADRDDKERLEKEMLKNFKRNKQ